MSLSAVKMSKPSGSHTKRWKGRGGHVLKPMKMPLMLTISLRPARYATVGPELQRA